MQCTCAENKLNACQNNRECYYIIIRCNVSVYLILLGAFGIGTNALVLSQAEQEKCFARNGTAFLHCL